MQKDLVTNVTWREEHIYSNHARNHGHYKVSQRLSCSRTFTDHSFRVWTEASAHCYTSENLLDKCAHENHDLVEVLDVVLPTVFEWENSVHIGTANHGEHNKGWTLPVTIVWFDAYSDQDKSSKEEHHPVVLWSVAVMVHFLMEGRKLVVRAKTGQLLFLVFLQFAVLDSHSFEAFVIALSNFWLDVNHHLWHELPTGKFSV